MEVPISEILKRLMTQYGPDILNEPGRLKALLNDNCGQRKREINLLLIALSEKIPNYLLSSKSPSIDDLFFHRLIQKLCDNGGVTNQAAIWAVKTWAFALNKVVSEKPRTQLITTKPSKTSKQTVVRFTKIQWLLLSTLTLLSTVLFCSIAVLVLTSILRPNSNKTNPSIGRINTVNTITQKVEDTSTAIPVLKSPTSKPKPTITQIPLKTSTTTPVKIYITGGNIGTKWTSDYLAISLLSVYETDMIDGQRPYGTLHGGYEHGFTMFLVAEINIENIGMVYEDFTPSSFYLISYSDDNAFGYMSDIFPSPAKRIFEGESYQTTVAFEIKPGTQNFNLCYKTSGQLSISNKYTECNKWAYPFTFRVK